jgi:hypothetical protein
MWNEQFFDGFTKALKCVIDDFDEHEFLSQIIDDEWENRELMQRGRHITTTLKIFLPPDYKSAIAIILEMINHIKETSYWLTLKQLKDTQYSLSNLCVTLCLLCVSLCHNYTELHRESTENHRVKIERIIF